MADARLTSVVTCKTCGADTLCVELADANPGEPPCIYRKMNWQKNLATRCRLIYGHHGDCLFDAPMTSAAFAEETIPPGFTDADYTAVHAAPEKRRGPAMRFRFHRGSLAASMATERTFRSRVEFLHALREWAGLWASPSDQEFASNLGFVLYGDGPDVRIGWERTYLVTLSGSPIGFADCVPGDLPEICHRCGATSTRHFEAPLLDHDFERAPAPAVPVVVPPGAAIVNSEFVASPPAAEPGKLPARMLGSTWIHRRNAQTGVVQRWIEGADVDLYDAATDCCSGMHQSTLLREYTCLSGGPEPTEFAAAICYSCAKKRGDDVTATETGVAEPCIICGDMTMGRNYRKLPPVSGENTCPVCGDPLRAYEDHPPVSPPRMWCPNLKCPTQLPAPPEPAAPDIGEPPSPWVQERAELAELLRHADNTDADDSLADALDALMERDNGGTEEDLIRATENVSAFLLKLRALLDGIDRAKAGE